MHLFTVGFRDEIFLSATLMKLCFTLISSYKAALQQMSFSGRGKWLDKLSETG